MQIVKYLNSTKHRGIILNPDSSRGVETFADADWCGNWDKTEAEIDESTAKSRSGYVILFMGCIIMAASKLQTLCTLSTTEAEYVALSEALRETIPIMNLLDEINKECEGAYVSKSCVRCKAFEDNSGALELALVPKIRPRTRHINNKYHHFRSAVRTGRISVSSVDTEEQIADIFTKPLNQNSFLYLRKKLLGW